MQCQDARVQGLWDVSDIRTLAVVASRWPAVIPEWQQVSEWHRPAMTPAGMRVLNPTPAAQHVGRGSEEWGAYRAMPRWQVVRERLLAHMFTIPEPAVLDMGCHVGACGIDLGNALPSVQVHLREVQPHIAALIPDTIRAYAWHPERVAFVVGDHEVPPLPARTYDAIWAGEILEHQWEWRAFIEALHASARVGALIAYSVPLGPWEPRERTRGEHLAQWELADVQAVFGAYPGFGGVCLQGENDARGFLCFWYHHDGAVLPAFPIEAKLRRWGFGE